MIGELIIKDLSKRNGISILMKTQFLSTLTNKKARTIFFLTLLYLQGVEAGQSFKNCLQYELSDTTAYDNLLKYPFPSGVLDPNHVTGALNVCCNATSCYRDAFSCNSFYFPCGRLGQNVYCGTWLWRVGSKKCWGVVGDGQVTTVSSAGACSSSQTNISFTASLISTQSLVGLSQGYAICGSGDSFSSSCMSLWDKCNWDNNGWNCFSINTNYQYCSVQWQAPWPGSAANNPYPIPFETTTASTITSSTATPTTLPSPTTSSSNDHLVEKIAITVGLVAGISLISGLTYYYCKKKRSRQSTLEDNSLQLEEQTSSHHNDLPPLPFDPKFNFEDNQQTNQRSVVDLNYQPQSSTHTPPLRPVPGLTFNSRTQLINHLKQKLVSHQQLWSDYLDANSLLLNNPQSQVAMRGFYQIQSQLLQFLTISEIELLKQTPLQTTSQFSIPQTENEYFGITENYSEEARHPQGEYFETRNPQGISNYHY